MLDLATEAELVALHNILYGASPASAYAWNQAANQVLKAEKQCFKPCRPVLAGLQCCVLEQVAAL